MNSIVMNLLWAALLLVFVIFLVVAITDYIYLAKKNNKLKQQLNSLALEYNYDFNHIDFLGNNLIAYDERCRVLAYITPENKPRIIELKDVYCCSISQCRQKRKILAINLTLNAGNGQLLASLPIYCGEKDNELSLVRFLKKAKKWHQIITDTVAANPFLETRLKI